MYPKTTITRTVRTTIMLFLILSFFVISPLVILYTIGYRYDLLTGIVRETGVLSIDVKPVDVHVFLDNVEIKKRIPIRLPNLIPGTYHLSLQKSGYQPWEKELFIEKKQTTYIRNVSLFQESEPTTFVDMKRPILDVVGSYDGRFLMMTTKEENVYEITLLDTETRAETTLVKAAADRIPFTAWSEFQEHALIELTHGNQSRVYVFSAENPTIIRSYAYKHQADRYAYQWKRTGSEPTLFIRDGKTIYRLTTNDETMIGETAAPIWYVDENNALWITSEERRSIALLKNEQSPAYETVDPIKKIVADRNKYMIIETDNGTKILKRDGNELSEQTSLPTDHIRYNRNTNEWITWSPWEIWNIYEDGSSALLNRTSEQINDIRPLDQFGVLLLIRDTSLTAFNPGYFVQHTLLGQTDKQTVAVNTGRRAMYLFTPGSSVIERLAY